MTHPLSRNTGELAIVSISFAIDAETDIEGFDGLSPTEVRQAYDTIAEALKNPEIVTQMCRNAWHALNAHANKTGLLSYGTDTEAYMLDTGENALNMMDPDPAKHQLPTEEERALKRKLWKERETRSHTITMPPSPDSLH